MKRPKIEEYIDYVKDLDEYVDHLEKENEEYENFVEELKELGQYGIYIRFKQRLKDGRK